jgi:excisionase family DNA binding protein
MTITKTEKEEPKTLAEETPRSLITSLRRSRGGPMTVKQLAGFLHVSKRSVYNAISDDNLPVIKIGGVIRIDPVHAADWLRARVVK